MAKKKLSWIVVFLLALPVLLGLVAILAYFPSRQPAASVELADVTGEPSEPWPDFTATADKLRTLFPVITADRQTGIFDAGAELWHEGYRIQNAWAGSINGVWAYILAGAYASNEQRGVVQVAREYPNAGYARFYDTPVRAGSVRIISEVNYRLTLESSDGTTFYFDIPSETYVTDLAQGVPTLVPPLTHTPAPTETKSPVYDGSYPGLDFTPSADPP